MLYTILYYTILYYTIPYYTILYTVLYYTILYYTILYYTILYCTILYYTILYYTILYYTILYYTTKAGRPGSSEVPRNPLTRLDVSSIQANGIFLTKKLKNKVKMPNGWRTIKSLVQKNLEAFGAVPRKCKGRKWVAFGVVVKDGRDWMTAAKNMGKWHRGVERGAEALDSAWRRADLRQSNVQLQREVSEVVQ